MSKLGDAIKRSQRVEATPMGFGAARPSPKPSLLVGFVGAAGGVAAAEKAGAEFILAESDGVDAAGAKKLRESASEAPLGALTNAGPRAASKELRESGLDFLAFEPEGTPAAALLDEDMGYVLVLPDKPEELFLRSLDSLSLEAVLLKNVPSPLTVVRQIELTQIAGLSRKPVIAQVAGELSSEDLQCLRAA